MASDTEPAGLMSVLRLAISDPGSVLPRKEVGADGARLCELLTHWQARAVAQAIGPFLAKPVAVDDADRPHVEEARRILAAFKAGTLSPPANYDALRALYDCGRTLLGVLDKTASAGKDGA